VRLKMDRTLDEDPELFVRPFKLSIKDMKMKHSSMERLQCAVNTLEEWDASTDPSKVLCDVCCSEDAQPIVLLFVPDFELPVFVGGQWARWRSSGGWYACSVCFALIQSRKRAALVNRAVNAWFRGQKPAAANEGCEVRRMMWAVLNVALDRLKDI